MLKNEHSSFRRMLEECKRWKVEVELTSTPPHAEYRHQRALVPSVFHPAPQSSAYICGKTSKIVWWDTRTALDAAQLAHELMHVVVWRELGDDPETCAEQNFLFLEYEACRRCKAHFTRGMDGYTVNYSHHKYGQISGSWHTLNSSQRGAVLKESREYLEEVGIITSRGKPTYVDSYLISGGDRCLRQRPPRNLGMVIPV
jgi:hypothetical protein